MIDTTITLKDIIGFVFSSVALAVSVYTLVRQGRNRVTIEWRPSYRKDKSANNTEAMFVVSAVNIGFRTLDIVEIGIMGSYSPLLTHYFEDPKKTEPGSPAIAYFDYSEVMALISQANTLYAKDSRNRIYSRSLSKETKKEILLSPTADAIASATQSVKQMSDTLNDQLDELAARSEESMSYELPDVDALARNYRQSMARGRMLELKKDYTGALSIAEIEINKDASNIGAWFLKAKMLSLLDRSEEAVIAARLTSELARRDGIADSDVYYNDFELARIFAKAGIKDKMLEHLSQARLHNPQAVKQGFFDKDFALYQSDKSFIALTKEE